MSALDLAERSLLLSETLLAGLLSLRPDRRGQYSAVKSRLKLQRRTIETLKRRASVTTDAA